jgi:hypothetical protein
VSATLIRPPESRIGPLPQEQRREIRKRSPISSHYDRSLDRESAYELLLQRAELAAERERQAEAQASRSKSSSKGRSRSRQGVGEAMLKSAARSMGRSLGSKLIRGLLGSLLR